MKKLMLIALVAAVALTGFAVAGEHMAKDVTLEGTIVCAKCAMKKEGLKDCQNVLVVEKDGADAENYWMVKNDTYKEYGDVCMAKKAVRVTGKVKEKEGNLWIQASKIEPAEKG